uniref:Uncharacterized protein n=1 Tax=Meloidogyne incognita TaxID=6306 RepID=A0A914LSH8_MELIC
MQTLRHIVRRDSSVSANFLPQNCEENNEQIRVLPVENKEENQQNNCSNSNANAMLFAVVLLLFVCIGPQAAARLLYEWHGIYHLNSVLYTCITQQVKLRKGGNWGRSNVRLKLECRTGRDSVQGFMRSHLEITSYKCQDRTSLFDSIDETLISNSNFKPHLKAKQFQNLSKSPLERAGYN